MGEADAFMADVEALCAKAPGLAPLHAALLIAVGEGIAGDTRAFSKVFGVAHALALRAASELDDRFVTLTDRNTRTQRTRLALTDAGLALLAA